MREPREGRINESCSGEGFGVENGGQNEAIVGGQCMGGGSDICRS